MESRIPREQWRQQIGEGNGKGLKSLVESCEVSGIRAYSEGEPVGWRSISPRAGMRSRGIMSELLSAAVTYAGERGARVE